MRNAIPRYVFLIIATLLNLGITAAYAVERPITAPDAYELNEEPFYFNKHRQQWVIIHYWADWCRGCVREIPTLNAFVKKHPEVIFRAVHLDDPSASKLLALKNKLKIQFPLIHKINSNHFPDPDKVRTIPAFFVFAPDAHDNYKSYRGSKSLSELEAIIRAHSAKTERKTSE